MNQNKILLTSFDVYPEYES